jgi:hypothetical protein
MRILRLLSSRLLPCGCLAGLYEAYAGPVVWIVDARGANCTNSTHRPGSQLDPAGRPNAAHAGCTAA